MLMYVVVDCHGAEITTSLFSREGEGAGRKATRYESNCYLKVLLQQRCDPLHAMLLAVVGYLRCTHKHSVPLQAQKGLAQSADNTWE